VQYSEICLNNAEWLDVSDHCNYLAMLIKYVCGAHIDSGLDYGEYKEYSGQSDICSFEEYLGDVCSKTSHMLNPSLVVTGPLNHCSGFLINLHV